MPDVYKQLTFEYIVLTILAVMVLAVVIGSIYAFVRAIIMFIFSHGETDQIKKAWSSIRFMILGIFLTIILLFVFPLVFRWMKVPNADEYAAKNIFTRAGDIIRGITDMGSWISDFQSDTQDGYYDGPSKVTPSGNYSL